jgi:hypothetical protein
MRAIVVEGLKRAVTQALDATRQGFVGMATLLGVLALREMRRTAL